jgi:hypothetical protein
MELPVLWRGIGFMTPFVIKNEQQYEEALAYVATLMDAPPGSAQEAELELWGTLVELYEGKVHPIGLPDPIEAIKFRMEQAGLKPAPPAEKYTLLRRLHFDLIGLPPTPDEVDRFGQDTSPDAYERVVDRLLASPQFGERWGRHWLDVARYAESSGKDVNIAFPHAWRYRDYVIAAFNSDKPYDQFLREQIAGDILAEQGPRKRYAERVTATGFLAISRRFVVNGTASWIRSSSYQDSLFAIDIRVINIANDAR